MSVWLVVLQMLPCLTLPWVFFATLFSTTQKAYTSLDDSRQQGKPIRMQPGSTSNDESLKTSPQYLSGNPFWTLSRILLLGVLDTSISKKNFVFDSQTREHEVLVACLTVIYTSQPTNQAQRPQAPSKSRRRAEHICFVPCL